jgi:hypothetical protein
VPIPSPNLDDRTYADLLDEARALIPSVYPEWTDHNPTDPGMTLVELFAWLTEMLIYRANRVPEASYRTFLKLLNGSATQLLNGPRRLPDDLDDAIRATVAALRERYRAATDDDYEYLAVHEWPRTPEAAALGADGVVKRARCVPGFNFELADPARRAAPGHVSLIVVPEAPPSVGRPAPTPALRQALWTWLDPRRLLTVRHHVVGPAYVTVGITARLFRRPNVAPRSVQERARDALAAYFHPLTGGTDQAGWPFGRAVYVSEVYEVLERVPGVDYATEVALSGDASRRLLAEDGSLVGIALAPHELVALNVTADGFMIG